MTRSKTWLAAATMAILALTSIALSAAVARPSDLTAAKIATGRFHSLSVAGKAGYGLLPPGAPLHECISHGADGAMGFHYINGNLLDTTLDPTQPEALVYAPELFGQMFMPVNALPNNNGLTVYNIPPFYMLHVWLWNSNPSGLFNPWNPSVSCAGAAASIGSHTASVVNATLASAKIAAFGCRIESNRA